jgi:hypothetical protein
MSDLGIPPAAPNLPPDFGQAGGGPSSDIPMWMVVVAAVVALGLAGLLAFAILSPSGTKTHQPTAQTSAPSYPAKWNHRIAPYARIAAKLRGLKFHHPVPVRFLPPAQFEKSLTAEQKKLSQSDRAKARQATGLLRAFGLISGNVNLVHAMKDFSGGATLAYYSFADKAITVRGKTMTPSVRATLVHELTHVLQDQHFHVGARLKNLEKQSKSGPSTSKESVLDAIVEGDAERVEHLYGDSLPASQRAALDAGQKAEFAQASKRLAQIPKVVVTELTSPYTLGEDLVQTVAASRGNGGVNLLFRNPPTHESSLLDPFRVLAGATRATKVAAPPLQPGEKKFDSGELGVLTWYFMLGERLPLTAALAAADGWGGDAYVGFERNGTTCARMAYTGRTPTDTTRMYDALQQWVAAAPGSPASVSRTGDGVLFESCDPGTAAAQVGNDDSQDALHLLTTRTSLGVAIMRAGALEATARCAAGRLVQTFTVSQLTDPTFGTNDPALQAQVAQLTAGCR